MCFGYLLDLICDSVVVGWRNFEHSAIFRTIVYNFSFFFYLLWILFVIKEYFIEGIIDSSSLMRTNFWYSSWTCCFYFVNFCIAGGFIGIACSIGRLSSHSLISFGGGERVATLLFADSFRFWSWFCWGVGSWGTDDQVTAQLVNIYCNYTWIKKIRK